MRRGFLPYGLRKEERLVVPRSRRGELADLPVDLSELGRYLASKAPSSANLKPARAFCSQFLANE